MDQKISYKKPSGLIYLRQVFDGLIFSNYLDFDIYEFIFNTFFHNNCSRKKLL